MPSGEKAAKKRNYFKKLTSLVETYPQVLIVHADNVGSKQFADIRTALRGKAIVLMGKNTMMRTALRQHEDKMPEVKNLIECVKFNIGLVFCIADMGEVRKIIEDNRVPAPARAGALAPVDVIVPAGPTALGPEQTSFFQALGISTKISKGTIEIQADNQVITKGERVGASQAALLQKLNIRPFSYGLVVQRVFDKGSVYSVEVLDIGDEDILKMFMKGVQNLAAFSKAICIPTEASLPHVILKGFKNLVALCIDSEYSFPQMESIKEFIANPDAFVVAGPAAGAAAAGGEAAPAEAKEEEKKVEEEEEEEDEDMGFSLFD
ncbi:unnamed protein product [Vitrella brassicaformis CCMP3155]|uniref:60S acidic ribosomal protein P0 n=1 Tax=Vitrella brassicaformis (strain CCMP3155) TaxID=1169540 RepID=A0A0G4E965_VITBC|nr:unnamed protein product [Vitrella brassicaformis CCMP3155]|eukprot:CEL91758.1 unnamed protein product [Vitrella brassicaformis CCMP3155]